MLITQSSSINRINLDLVHIEEDTKKKISKLLNYTTYCVFVYLFLNCSYKKKILILGVLEVMFSIFRIVMNYYFKHR